MSSTGSVAGHPVVTGVRGAARDLGPGLPGLVWQLSDDEVEDALAGSFGVESRLQALQGALLREAETRDLKARTKALTEVRWLGDRFRLSRADAGARVRAGQALGRHPVLAGALAAGAVTVEQAETLTPVLDAVEALPELEDQERAAAARFLVAQCATLTPRDLAKVGRALVEALTVTSSLDDPADEAALERERARAEAEAQEAERSFLTVTRRRGKLLAVLEPGTLGEAVLAEWTRTNEKKHPGADGFEDTRPRSERLGDAMVALLAHAAGTPTPRPTNDHHDHHDQPTADEPGDEPGADETDDEPDAATAAEPDPDEPDGEQQPLPGLAPPGRTCGSCGSRPQAPEPLKAVVAVTTTLDGLRSGLAKQGRLDTGLALSAAALRMLACDGLIIPAVLGSDSEVLDLGRAHRDFNRAQRRAAALRDRGCVAPGCDQPPSACHVHHMWWWIDGGPTDLDNAALLCDVHHRMVHRQGWAMTLARNGYPQLTPPKSIDPEQRPRQHHRFLIPDQRRPRDPTSSPGRQRT
jgi:hypothetical protein